MLKITCLLVLFILSVKSYAQEGFKRNDIYLEAGGASLFGGISYEHQLTAKPGLGFRLGLGFYTEKAFFLSIPIGLNYLFPVGKKQSFIDAGMGATFARYNARVFTKTTIFEDEHFVSFIPSFGYRRHTPRNVMWRIALTPLINNRTFVPWVGAAIGKRF